MKLGQKYKIEKPKTEEELVLSAEGLTDIMFGDKVNQEGFFDKVKDIIKAKYEAFKKWQAEHNKKDTKDSSKKEYRLTKEGKEKLKKLIEKQQNELISFLKTNKLKLVKDVSKWPLHFGPLKFDKIYYEELWKMQSGEKYDFNYLPDEINLLYLAEYEEVIDHSDIDENWEVDYFYSELEKHNWFTEDDSDIYGGIIGFYLDRKMFKENIDYILYDPKEDENENK